VATQEAAKDPAAMDAEIERLGALIEARHGAVFATEGEGR